MGISFERAAHGAESVGFELSVTSSVQTGHWSLEMNLRDARTYEVPLSRKSPNASHPVLKLTAAVLQHVVRQLHRACNIQQYNLRSTAGIASQRAVAVAVAVAAGVVVVVAAAVAVAVAVAVVEVEVEASTSIYEYTCHRSYYFCNCACREP